MAATLLRLAAPGVIDNEPAHNSRGIAHKAAFVGKFSAVPSGDIQIRFVQEFCNRQTYSAASPSQLPFC